MKYLSDELPHYLALERFIESGACGKLLHQEKNALFHVPEHFASFESIGIEIARQLSVDEKKLPPLPETLPTRYDNPFSYRIVERLIRRLKNTCQLLGVSADKFPPFACIPTGVINAYAANVPGSDNKFLLFDSQVFFFCNLWSKVLATAQPIVDIGSKVSTSTDILLVRNYLESNPTPVVRLRELLHASISSSPSDAPPYLPNPNYVPLISLLRDSMELFIVAHEFGHVYAGHLGPLLAAIPKGANELLSDANQEQRMEYEADAIALLLTMRCLAREGLDFALSYIGPYMFFSGLDILEKYAVRIYGPSENCEPSEHPSNANRQKMLNEMAGIFVEVPEMEMALKLQKSFACLVKELDSRLGVMIDNEKRINAQS